MYKETFYMTNRMTVMLEMMIEGMDSLEEFEKKFPSEFLANDDHVGSYLDTIIDVSVHMSNELAHRG